MKRGRGPKGWTRPDERILDEFCERAVRSGIDASQVEVRCRDGALRLDGCVATPADRGLLCELATDVLGVTSVESTLLAEGEGEETVEPDPLTRH